MANYIINTYTASELGTDAKLQVTGAAYNNSTLVAHNAIAGITAGMSVSGDGIPTGATVTVVDTNNNQFTLSEATTGGSKTGETLILTNIVTPTLIITPRDGYVIRAHDFSIHNASRGSGADINKWTGGDLSSIAAVSSVTFVDLETNYTPGIGYSETNTIRVDVGIANGFAINNQNHNISLDINGEAHLPQDIAVSIPIDFNLLASITGVNYNITNLASGLTWTTNNTGVDSNGDSLFGTTLSGTTQDPDVNISGTIEVTPEQQQEGEVVIGEVVIDVVEGDLPASQDSNNSNDGVIEEVVIEQEEEEQDPIAVDDNVLPQQPGGGFDPGTPTGSTPTGGDGIDVDLLELVPKDVIVDTDEQIPDNVTYELVLNTAGRLVAGQKSKFRLKAKAVSPPAVSATKVINSVSFGSTTISANGETRVMKVFGDVGAKVNIGIYTDTGTIGTEDGSETADIVNITNGEITSSTTFARGQGVFTFTATFPSTSSTKNYGLQISAVAGSSLSSSITQGAGSTYDYNFQQFANPTITINAVTTHGDGSGATYNSLASQLSNKQITRVGVANTIGSSLNHIRGKSDTIPINWVFTNVAGGLNFSKPLTLDNSIIKDGGFESQLTHWTAAQIGTGNNTVAHFVDATNGDYVQRTGSDSNSVTLQQNGVLEIGRQYTFVLEYSEQTKAGGQITIEAGTASSNAQDLTQSNANVRHKIVTTLTAAGNTNLKITFNNDATVRVHSITTSSFTNSIPEENGGTSLRIIDAQTTINSTTVTVAGTLKVLFYGNSDVTMNVDLADLFGSTN